MKMVVTGTDPAGVARLPPVGARAAVAATAMTWNGDWLTSAKLCGFMLSLKWRTLISRKMMTYLWLAPRMMALFRAATGFSDERRRRR